ncbi:MAG: 3-hydroxyacyl-ACP dehydratase FabZ [Gammaproteobacteria bacterium]
MSLDTQQILKRLPHRYPFLLVDRVIECKSGQSIVAVKNVTYNEPFFPGHFPGRPVMPGVLILEAMAQTTALLTFGSEPEGSRPDTFYYLVGVDKARFKKPVVPGDQLRMEARLTRELRGIFRFETEARVDGKLVASAEIMATQASGPR